MPGRKSRPPSSDYSSKTNRGVKRGYHMGKSGTARIALVNKGRRTSGSTGGGKKKS